MHPWLSVVTVVKDDIDGLERTVQSLLGQDALDRVEYVVIDSSSDRTASGRVIDRVRGFLPVTYRWTDPAGIYTAMNLGLDVSTGETVYFANAGDGFYTQDVLRLAGAAWSNRPEGIEWMFGAVEIIGMDGSRVITPPWDYARERAGLFSRGHFPPHQGTFAARALLNSVGGFDIGFRIAADYAAFLSMSLRSDPLELPFVIASFREGGASTTDWKVSFQEFHQARVSVFRPHGVGAIRETWSTWWHFAKVFIHREVLNRGANQ